MLDLAKAVYKRFKNNKILPKIVIYELEEVTQYADAVATYITTKVNQTCRKLDSVAEQIEQAPIFWPTK